MPIVTTLLGAVLGVMIGRGFDAAIAGGFVGLIAGLVFNSWRKSRAAARLPAAAPFAGADADPFLLLDPRVAERMQAMERRIAALEAALRGSQRSRACSPARREAALPLRPQRRPRRSVSDARGPQKRCRPLDAPAASTPTRALARSAPSRRCNRTRPP